MNEPKNIQVFKNTSITNTQFTEENNISFYIKNYNNSLNDFIKYANSLDENDVEKLNKNVINSMEYKINTMEINLLLVTQYCVFYDIDFLMKSEGYLFVLTEVFFIKSCKNMLKIPSIDEYTNNLSSEVFKIFESIIRKVDSKMHSSLFLLGESSFDPTFFHKKSNEAISSLIEKANSKSESLKLYMYAKNEINDILSIIKPFFKDNESYLNTIETLKISIEFRFKRKKYLEEVMDLNFKNQLIELKEITEKYIENSKDSLDFIENCKNDPDLLKELTNEEISSLDSEYYRLDSIHTYTMSKENLANDSKKMIFSYHDYEFSSEDDDFSNGKNSSKSFNI